MTSKIEKDNRIVNKTDWDMSEQGNPPELSNSQDCGNVCKQVLFIPRDISIIVRDPSEIYFP